MAILIKKQPLVAGTHIWLALEGVALSRAGDVIKPAGDATAYTSVGVNAKPVFSPNTDAAWKKFVRIQSGEFDPGNGTPIVITDAVPGPVVPVDVIRTGQQPKIKFTGQQMEALPIHLALGGQGDPADDAATFNPFSSPVEKKGWLHIQIYDHQSNLWLTIESWCELSLGEALKTEGKTGTFPKYEAMLLWNPLSVYAGNSGTE